MDGVRTFEFFFWDKLGLSFTYQKKGYHNLFELFNTLYLYLTLMVPTLVIECGFHAVYVHWLRFLTTSLLGSDSTRLKSFGYLCGGPHGVQYSLSFYIRNTSSNGPDLTSLFVVVEAHVTVNVISSNSAVVSFSQCLKICI